VTTVHPHYPMVTLIFKVLDTSGKPADFGLIDLFRQLNRGRAFVNRYRYVRFERFVDAFERHPESSEAGHGPTGHPIFNDFTHARRIENGNGVRRKRLFALVCDRRRFGRVVIAADDQHAHVRLG